MGCKFACEILVPSLHGLYIITDDGIKLFYEQQLNALIRSNAMAVVVIGCKTIYSRQMMVGNPEDILSSSPDNTRDQHPLNEFGSRRYRLCRSSLGTRRHGSPPDRSVPCELLLSLQSPLSIASPGQEDVYSLPPFSAALFYFIQYTN